MPSNIAKKSVSGSKRMIVDFLMNRVVFNQPEEIQHFLAVTSLFDRFCAPLCDFLLTDTSGINDSQIIIEWLQRQNLFLVPLDSKGRWYRYNLLFQKLLYHKLSRNLSRQRRQHLHQRAGKWFAGQGLIEEALCCFLAAGDDDAASGLLEDNLHAIIDDDMSIQLDRAMKPTAGPAGVSGEAFVNMAAREPSHPIPPENLSNRELDVLILLKYRLTNKEIAEHLFISPETVKKHTCNIYRKLNVHSRRQAIAAARDHGLFQD